MRTIFSGRLAEMEQLNRFYEKARDRVACVYGRTGIGKTTLLKEFARDKKTIFFTAYATTDTAELDLLSVAVADANGGVMPEMRSLHTVLDAISEIGKREPVLFIIDHYPNFVKAGADFDEILYTYVTTQWNRLPVKLILCGDSYLAMDKKVYGKKALWKDQLSLVMEVGAMNYYDSRTFFPDVPDDESVMFYGLTGGIPYALSHVGRDVGTTMTRLFLKDEDDLTMLPEKTLAVDLRELSYYNRMLTTLAAGKTRVNQISAEVGKPKDIVVPYMNTLMSIGFVKKENPVTEKRNRKKTRYSIVNTYDLFWYKFIVPHISLYYSGDFKRLMTEGILPELVPFKQAVFTQMCKEYLIREAGLGELPFTVSEIGNWWENDEEHKTSEGFDLVALGNNGDREAIIFARCYYTDVPVEISTLKELIELTKHLKQPENGDIFYLVFSSCGFHVNTQTVASTIRNIMLISLSDVCHAADEIVLDASA